jgi:hypothetical protein
VTLRVFGSNPADVLNIFWISDIGMDSDVDIRYRNDSFQSDIFSSDIGITDVDVGYRISPSLRSMSMPTYGYDSLVTNSDLSLSGIR